MKAVLFWHYCGFAYIVGEADEAFLSQVCKMLHGKYEKTQRRFILQIEDERLAAYFDKQPGIMKKDRLCFKW